MGQKELILGDLTTSKTAIRQSLALRAPRSGSLRGLAKRGATRSQSQKAVFVQLAKLSCCASNLHKAKFTAIAY